MACSSSSAQQQQATTTTSFSRDLALGYSENRQHTRPHVRPFLASLLPLPFCTGRPLDLQCTLCRQGFEFVTGLFPLSLSVCRDQRRTFCSFLFGAIALSLVYLMGPRRHDVTWPGICHRVSSFAQFALALRSRVSRCHQKSHPACLPSPTQSKREKKNVNDF